MTSSVKPPPSAISTGIVINLTTLGLSTLGHDLVGGSVSALVTLCFSLSFAAMIFAGDLAPHLGFGISMALMSAAVTVVVVALRSPFRFAIAGPDSRSAAVQSTLAATLAQVAAQAGLTISYVLIALSFTTAATGAILYTSGRLNMGRFIRYVPYPVIGGFLASTGWTLCVGGIRVISSTPVTMSTLGQLVSADVLLRLGVGVGFTLGMLIILGRTKHFLALPGILAFGTTVVHVVRAVLHASVAQAQESGWLLKIKSGGHLWLPLRDVNWSQAGGSILMGESLLLNAGGLLALAAVTAIGVLVTGAAIEVATRSDVDLDQELKAHGLANLLSGFFGGLVGQNAIARSMINLQAGATTRMSGVFAGSLCLLVALTKPELAGYLARPVMGATLAYLGLRLINDWVIKARTNLERMDYLLVIGMLGMIIRFGFVIGLLVGVIVSCLIFAINYSRISVVKYSFTLDEYGSKVQRSVQEHKLLRERGRQHWVLRLRGYLFFGSVVRMVQEARQRIESNQAAGQPLKTLVLDFAGVIGIDSSTALTLVKLRQVAENSSLQLVFTALQPEMEKMLRRERCLCDDNVCLTLAHLDLALELCEKKILAEQTEDDPNAHSIRAQLAIALGSDEFADRFLSYTERITLEPEQYLAHQGDASSEVYVIESGRVSILLERPNAPPLRLRSVTSNTCLGEIGHYRNSPRTASMVADVKTTVLSLSRSALLRMEDEVPKVATAFHVFIIRTLADRLVASDKAIAALER